MTKLDITKQEESDVVIMILKMGAESLDPDNYDNLENAMKAICLPRSLNHKEISDAASR